MSYAPSCNAYSKSFIKIRNCKGQEDGTCRAVKDSKTTSILVEWFECYVNSTVGKPANDFLSYFSQFLLVMEAIFLG